MLKTLNIGFLPQNASPFNVPLRVPMQQRHNHEEHSQGRGRALKQRVDHCQANLTFPFTLKGMYADLKFSLIDKEIIS